MRKLLSSGSTCVFVLSVACLLSSHAWAEPASAKVSGTIVDKTGAAVIGANIKFLQSGNAGSGQEAVSDDNGRFSFSNVAVGAFEVSVTARGFGEQHRTGTLHEGQTMDLAPVILEVEKVTTDVRVSAKQTELAEEQLEVEEEQRLIGFLPNYYVSYLHEAVPLAPRQKFQLAWKTTLDPVSFAVTGIVAGVEQWQNSYKGYGQGAEGYAKRFGAAHADFLIGNMLSRAVLPIVFKQDPRYFVKGTGSARSRALYAIANAVICKGDNGHWQPRYSHIFGELAAAGISNLYYPAADRNGAGLTFKNAGFGIGASAGAHLFEEFLSRKLTPKKR